MTRDDIIRMAKEAGFNQILATTTGANVWIDDGFYVEELERFAALVAAAEREKCANFVEACAGLSTFVWKNESDSVSCQHFANSVAAAIRARNT